MRELFHILGNLDQEVDWLGGGALPMHVRTRISAYAALLSALAPSGEQVLVWALEPIDGDRFVAQPGWQPPRIVSGTSPPIDLAWADPAAKAVNDRRFALDLATTLGCALPGAVAIATVAELEATAVPGQAWVCKAPWTSAGRDRCFGTGPVLDPELRATVTKLIARAGAVVFEPWLPRICDVAVCGRVDGAVTLEAPHTLVTNKRGSFYGIELGTTGLEIAEHDILLMIAEHVGLALQRAGYRGPFGVDAFVYRDGDRRVLHPLCEINARHTFGHVAHALRARLGTTHLSFAREPPPGAKVLVRPSANDTTVVSVW